MTNYDIVIIGSGMGGLICADILGREGYAVCILEKNKQIGGCLQTYARDRVIFDSGVHYLGGLSKGQNMYQIFKYLGIIDKLKLQEPKDGIFDKILLDNDDKEYSFAQGYENFVQHLLKDFPAEEKALRAYCARIQEVCAKFPLYNLESGGSFQEKAIILEQDTKSFIQSLTTDEKLQAVLAGNSMLYALQGEKTPFYVHAMILNSYIESSRKCIDGGSVIGKYMAKNIRAHGGNILRNAEVTKINVEDGEVRSVLLKDGSLIHGKNFISNMHPVRTLDLTETDLIKKAYKSRIRDLENSIGGFAINIVFKKDSYKYCDANYYYHQYGHVWDLVNYSEAEWPRCYAVFFSASSRSDEFAESMTILAYMKFEEVKRWENTFNTVSEGKSRGEDYEAFKIRKAEVLLDLVEEKFPRLRSCIKTYYTSTPLSYRDYIGNDDGSMYGIVKDHRNPLKTFISPKTKIPNLFLTGQNLNLHGILGAAMSGLVTCISFLGNDDIIKKIKDA